MDNMMHFAEKTISIPSAEDLSAFGIKDVGNWKIRELIYSNSFLFYSVSDDLQSTVIASSAIY